MLAADRIWSFVGGADEAALRRLQAATSVELPAEYLGLLKQTNGGEGPLAVQPLYLRIDPAEEVALALKERTHDEFFPGFVVVGSNGGGEYVALDVRASAPPSPVVQST